MNRTDTLLRLKRFHVDEIKRRLASIDAMKTDLEKKLAMFPVIAVPTITLEGDANGAPHPDPGSYANKFSGKYANRIITGGIGHNLPQEAPGAFAQAIVDAAVM